MNNITGNTSPDKMQRPGGISLKLPKIEMNFRQKSNDKINSKASGKSSNDRTLCKSKRSTSHNHSSLNNYDAMGAPSTDRIVMATSSSNNAIVNNAPAAKINNNQQQYSLQLLDSQKLSNSTTSRVSKSPNNTDNRIHAGAESTRMEPTLSNHD